MNDREKEKKGSVGEVIKRKREKMEKEKERIMVEDIFRRNKKVLRPPSKESGQERKKWNKEEVESDQKRKK